MTQKIMRRLGLTLCSSISTPKTNKEGEDYKPESLKVMMASLDRHLGNKGCILSIVRDRELVRPKRCWRTKRNSFAWLAVVSAQTKLASIRGGRRNSLEERKTRGNNPESFKDHKLHQPYGLAQFCSQSLKKFTRAYLFQIALEIM